MLSGTKGFELVAVEGDTWARTSIVACHTQGTDHSFRFHGGSQVLPANNLPRVEIDDGGEIVAPFGDR